jgi:hypothetical protein
MVEPQIDTQFDGTVPATVRGELCAACREVLSVRPATEAWSIEVFWDSQTEYYLFRTERDGIRVDANGPDGAIGWQLPIDYVEVFGLRRAAREHLSAWLQGLDSRNRRSS